MAMDLYDIAGDLRRQTIFDVVLEEACRQWFDVIDDAPERKEGVGFANFFYEIFEQKEDEYWEEYVARRKSELGGDGS